MNLDKELTMRYSTRVKMGVALFACLALSNDMRDFRTAVSALDPATQVDPISQYERRFSEIKPLLPATESVLYGDEFDKVSKQCNAFVLAQYAVVPTVLVALDSMCRNSVSALPESTHFVLDNPHDSRQDPYLLDLFPGTYFRTSRVGASFDMSWPAASEFVLAYDSGSGPRLYVRRKQ